MDEPTTNHKRSRRGRTLALACLIGATALSLGKLAWVAAFRVSGRGLAEGKAHRDLLNRRAYLIHRLHIQGAGLRDMPSHLPDLFQSEWAVGAYSMAAMAFANLAFRYPDTREESLLVVGAMIERLLTPKFRRFDTRAWNEDSLTTLESPRGHLGYLGHLNLTLAAYKYMGGDSRHDDLFRRVTQALRAKLEASSFLLAETYPGEIYVPDIVAAVASVALAERWMDGRAAFADRWTALARKRLLDRSTGLLPFKVDRLGRTVQGPRGCGAGWNSYYLTFIDAAFARDQYNRMKSVFAARPYGIAGLREWPRGIDGAGDVDSGPLILGLTPSGTGFAVAGALAQGDTGFLDDLLRTAEIAGFSVQWRGRRTYLTAPLVGDAIMLAMKSVTPWDRRFVPQTQNVPGAAHKS